MSQEVRVVIYKITGNQLFFKMPESLCEECDLMVGVVDRVVKELREIPARIEVKPWLNRMLSSLMRGGYHPPILLVDGKLICQGRVPDPQIVRESILEAWAKRKARERREAILEQTRQDGVRQPMETRSPLDTSVLFHW